MVSMQDSFTAEARVSQSPGTLGGAADRAPSVRVPSYPRRLYLCNTVIIIIVKMHIMIRKMANIHQALLCAGAVLRASLCIRTCNVPNKPGSRLPTPTGQMRALRPCPHGPVRKQWNWPSACALSRTPWTIPQIKTLKFEEVRNVFKLAELG